MSSLAPSFQNPKLVCPQICYPPPKLNIDTPKNDAVLEAVSIHVPSDHPFLGISALVKFRRANFFHNTKALRYMLHHQKGNQRTLSFGTNFSFNLADFFWTTKSLGFFFVWQIFLEGFLGSWGSLHDQIELSWKMMEKHQTNIESSGSNSHGNWVFVDVLATKSCSRKHPPTSTVTFSLSLAERRARVTLPSLGHWALTAAGVTLFSDINPPKQCTLCFGEMPANDHTCFIKFDPPKWVPFNDFNDPRWLTLVVSLHHKRLLAGCHQDGGRPEILLFAAQIYNVLCYYLKGSTSNWVATVPPTNSKNWHDVSQDFQNNMQCIRFRFFIWTYATSSKKQARKLSNCAVDPQIPYLPEN